MGQKTFSENWFDNNVANNQEDLLVIGGMAARELEDKFHLKLTPYMAIAIYGITAETIFDYMKEMQEKGKDHFQLNICDLISISYNNNTDDENEKLGNFMPFIQQINDGPLPDTGIDNPNTLELCSAWNSSHISEQPDVLRTISAMAVRNVSDKLNLKTAATELIMPVFCTVHQNILSYIKLKRVDLKVTAFTLDVCGIYDVEVSEAGDATEIITYPQRIYTKKTTKDDRMSAD